MTGASNPAFAKAPEISLVVPAYNEARRLPNSIRDIRSFFGRFLQAGFLEVIIVVEKSTDGTLALAQAASEGEPMISIIANDVQRGKGYAVKTGMLKARGQIVFFMDADLSTPLAEVMSFLAIFTASSDVDIVIGSRAEAESRIIKRQSIFRQSLGRGFNRFVQAFGVKGIKDTQCGFKAFRQKTVQPVFSRQTLDGFAFDVELLLLAEAMGFKYQTAPVRWVNSADSKVRIWIDPLKMLFDLIRIKWIVRRTLKERPYAPVS
ncbi:MAG: glycosyltransferase family 2 protein [Bdellovibrionales bacterium]|jgi:dolichyl-phosphate beta-glucosyltransferase|nr:glycosyltransferase family 2 protein [Bdellovibrionales bacterium]